ncbi:MAG: DNA-binding protein [Pseudonocardiales bacterium]|nr:DNA-binding protein [Jatrophihabitantaceae bacterium]MCW2603236.1 DNA-binding protein [Pseudonocardiales bacterium]
MSETPAPSPSSIDLLPLPDVALLLDEGIIKVEQHVKDDVLIVVRNDAGIRTIPALFIQDGAIVKHLDAVIRLLRDARYTDAEVVEWLHRVDDTLPGSPIQALRADRSREVKRRAQAEL